MIFLRKISNFFPNFPRLRYGIYCGTNTKKELWMLLSYFFMNLFSLKEKQNFINKFENQFSKKSRQKYSFTYGSGRMALYSILQTMNIKKGDQIILPAFTCAVVPNAIIYTGARPIYVDIEPKNFNINVNLIEKKITNKTIAIYVQHTFGISCDMKKINKLAKKYKLKIIEDKAHVFDLKRVQNKNTYASYYSLDHSKIINTHLGGVATTNNFQVYKKLKKYNKSLFTIGKMGQLRMLISFILEIIIFNPYLLWIGKPIFLIFNYFNILFYFNDELKIIKPRYYPCKYNNFLSLVGVNQLKNIKKNINHRVKLSQFFEKKIKWYQFKKSQVSKYSWLRYSFLVKDQEKFIKIFQKKFNLDIWYSSIFEGRSRNYNEIKYKDGSCPVAEYVSKHIVNFPTHIQIPLNTYQKIIKENWSWLRDQINYDKRNNLMLDGKK